MSTSERYSRQSFLGSDSQAIIERTKVAFVGLGGGGSHIVQQCAHIGFKRYATFDGDHMEMPNLNRTVGSTLADAEGGRPKTEVAERLIRALHPDAVIEVYSKKWQEAPEALKRCHLVFGCVDGFSEREQLEQFARRYLLSYIDIGMDVMQIEGGSFSMFGQVIASLPGRPCMRCMQFLTDELLGKEAAHYGAAGPRPQVVWPNGVLASSAVGMAMNLLTGWAIDQPLYLEYDGNANTVIAPSRLFNPNASCPHYSDHEVGDPVYRSI